MKTFLFTSLCGFAIAAAAATPASASDDYTGYVKNPSFEQFAETDGTPMTEDGSFRGWKIAAPKEWTVGGSVDKTYIVNATSNADNGFGQFGTIADGTYAFYSRMGWTDGSSQLSQTLKALPAGSYTLSVDWKGGYANSAESSFTLRAGNATSNAVKLPKGSAGFMPNNKWQTASVNFNNATAGDVVISFNFSWISGGSCVAIDNVRLVRTGEPGTTPDPEPQPVGDSPTEGVITHDFVGEAQMTADLMQMLADFTRYMTNNVQTISDKNREGDAMISFKGENTLGNNEQGVRHNADMSMICAYLVKYAKDKVKLPEGIDWAKIEDLAMKSLVYSYSTHKANKLYPCKNNNYWGSTSRSDNQWESSLWAMSVAYSAFFQWEKLSESQRKHIEAMLVAECQYELERNIPTGYAGDTKAEENGWEADILAATLGLFPNHDKAPQWFDRLREFAVNSYSHPSDASDDTVLDPDYDNKTVADLYKGQNLYEDYTLQNHNLFHTSYQNVVMQELGEAALALKLFQTGIYGTEKWKTNALMHNNQEVMDEVLNWLALADGELAMPNGNDWSLFLFDQITSYSTMACFLKDPNALFLENMAYKYIKARQTTTADGSWLLRADVGGRRMGVEGHRVMMTALMHQTLSTASVTPSTWPSMMEQYGKTKIFPCQNVIRSSSASRFTTFSWSSGLKSYTGYIASQNPDNNKIIVPYRANNTGNFLGWYTVSGKKTDASPVVSGIYQTTENSFAMNGELNTNGGALNNRFAIYSTPGNAVIYIDLVRASADATITKEQGGLMAVSVDEFTRLQRTFYSNANTKGQTLDGTTFTTIPATWANIDNELGFVAPGNKGMAFGERANNNSIMTAKFMPLYSEETRNVKSGEQVDARCVIYYTSVDAATTKTMSDKVMTLTPAANWNGVIAPDPDGVYYMLLSNFASFEKGKVEDVVLEHGAPVFSALTTVKGGKSNAEFVAQMNNSIADELRAYISGADVTAIQDAENPLCIYIQNNGNAEVSPTVAIIGTSKVSDNVKIGAGETVRVWLEGDRLRSEASKMPAGGEGDLTTGYYELTDTMLANPGFEADKTYGKLGPGKVGNTTYEQCFTNEVAPLDPNVPNILPVEGWVNGTSMKSSDGNRAYRRMYSMPYSTLIPCVSEAGNYSALCAPAVGDDRMGERCLTVLNSWASGENKITQAVTLNAGDYRVLIKAKYECPNQTANTGKEITAGGNTNSSLTGVKIGDKEDYSYPAQPSQWETLVYDFSLTEATPVTISLGYASSAEVGAANQSLMYIDDVRLLGKNVVGIDAVIAADEADAPVYTLSGVRLPNGAKLAPGVYLKGSQKIYVK